YRSALLLAEPRDGRGVLPPADIARPCRRYSPVARARLRNRQGTVRLARSADAPASSMPRSRSPTCSFPFVIGHRWPSQRRRRTALLWRAGALRFTEKCRSRHASSPLLDLPIRQVMGVAHYVPQPPLSKMPGGGAGAVARRPPSRVAAGFLCPRRLHLAAGGGRDRFSQQADRLWPADARRGAGAHRPCRQTPRRQDRRRPRSRVRERRAELLRRTGPARRAGG